MEPRSAGPRVSVLVGNALDRLRELPDRSVQCVVTSPPYWGLRDYSRCDCMTPSFYREAETNPQKEGRGRIVEDDRGDRHTPGGALAFYQPGKPDPNCQKCGGTGRDPSLEVIWDDANGCPHEWGDPIVDRSRATPGTSGSGLTNAGQSQATSARFEKQSAACLRCGSWRGQLGLEPSPEMYVRHIVAVFREARRVIRDDGTLWLNMGDCYNRVGERDGRTRVRLNAKDAAARDNFTTGSFSADDLKEKDMVGMPWRVAFALQADGWYLRSDIIWAKPNPMPESVTDRPTKAHEYVFLLAKTGRYFYDGQGIRETLADSTLDRMRYHYPNEADNPEYDSKHDPGDFRRFPIMGRLVQAKYPDGWDTTTGTGAHGSILRSDREAGRPNVIPPGRNARTVWTIPTQPYPEAHFATFPERLVDPCIRAGTPQRGSCPTCGAPWHRITKTERTYESGSGRAGNLPEGKSAGASDRGDINEAGDVRMGPTVHTSTIGWERSCGCELGDPVPSIVLDPFAGSGTVGKVARDLGRSAILIEIKSAYVGLVKKRARVGLTSLEDFM